MRPLTILFIVLSAGAIAYLIFRLALSIREYLHMRGERLVTCPETHRTVAVSVDATKAAAETFSGAPHLRLKDCTRWPEKKNCGQDCLAELEADPAGCLVWNIVNGWYEGKKCAYCGKPFSHINWHDHRPAVLVPPQVEKQLRLKPQPEKHPLVIKVQPAPGEKPVDVFEVPADMSGAGKSGVNVTVQWNEISPEQLPDIFSSARPVCWDCHIAESFRREHAELVTNRAAH